MSHRPRPQQAPGHALRLAKSLSGKLCPRRNDACVVACLERSRIALLGGEAASAKCVKSQPAVAASATGLPNVVMNMSPTKPAVTKSSFKLRSYSSNPR